MTDQQAPVYETDQPVLYAVADGVARITLNRPAFGNAQNGQMTYAIDDAFRRAAADDAAGAIILAGAGKHFCGGHDIGTPGRDVTVSAPGERRFLWPDHAGKPGAEQAYAREQEIYLEMCRRWRSLPKPVVAAVQGACIAGGLMLAWVCDLIVASEDAFFSDPVLRMGVPGVEYFAHAFEMHPRVAREFLFLGDRMPAERAYQLGMVNRVVPREGLAAEVDMIAARLAALPRFGVALAKQAFNLTEDLGGKRGAMEAVFGLHHLAHAHNSLTVGHGNGGLDAKAMAAQARG
ncbi:enoyl-CoA hydratase [Sphingomonas profundi]|uniref:enoyl-CoA hydratase n=1 Tax=Alterirhizorhabdus profundi TaxID=2681549 RepID=UPI0012E9776A|nr:enoyl-CoA hydratase [Sphingomonas profundi]